MSQSWYDAFSLKRCPHCDMPSIGQALMYIVYEDYLGWLDGQAARDRKSHAAKRLIANIIRAA